MPRDRRAPAAVATRETNSLVASATWYSGKQERLYLPPKDWQRECYRHYSICGEARAAAQYYGNALSRCNLGIAKRDREGNLKAAKSGEAVRVLKALADGCGGQSQLMKSVGVHMCIAGECYIVGRKVNGADTWEVVSVIEMEVSGQNVWSINYHDGKPPVALGENDPVIRVWHQHPEKKIEADSPFRSMLPILREIEWTTRHVFSQVTSRLAGAGLLLLPNGATFPAPPAMEGEDPTGQTTTEEIHGIMRVLADTMMIPLSNPDSPAARVPIVIKVPDESVDKIKLLHFWSELDDKVLEIRNNDILRFARGMDLPQEQIMGMSSNPGTGGGASNGVSHWGAWQIEESTIKMFIEPMCEMIASALTLQYLRQIVETEEEVTYDSSALRMRPDKSELYLTLYQMGAVSLAGLYRECNIPEEDRMADEERRDWLLMRIAGGSATPDQVQAALAILGVPLPSQGGSGQEGTPRETRPAPSLEGLPNRPRTPDAASLLPVCEALVLRALERAGNRIRQITGVKPPNVHSYEMHTLHQCNGSTDTILADAWSTAPMVLQGVADVPRTIQMLDAYCRSLMDSQEPHTRERLSRFLEALC